MLNTDWKGGDLDLHYLSHDHSKVHTQADNDDDTISLFSMLVFDNLLFITNLKKNLIQ